MSVLPFDLLEQLEIPDTKSVPFYASTPGGPIECRRYEKGIEACILGRKIRLEGIFVCEPDRDAFGGNVLLGRRDFFSHFMILFDHSRGDPIVQLTPTA